MRYLSKSSWISKSIGSSWSIKPSTLERTTVWSKLGYFTFPLLSHLRLTHEWMLKVSFLFSIHVQFVYLEVAGPRLISIIVGSSWTWKTSKKIYYNLYNERCAVYCSWISCFLSPYTLILFYICISLCIIVSFEGSSCNTCITRTSTMMYWIFALNPSIFLLCGKDLVHIK